MLLAILVILAILLKVRRLKTLARVIALLLVLQLGIHFKSPLWITGGFALVFGIWIYGLGIALPAAWRRHGLETLAQLRLKKG